MMMAACFKVTGTSGRGNKISREKTKKTKIATSRNVTRQRQTCIHTYINMEKLALLETRVQVQRIQRRLIQRLVVV